MFNSKLEKHLRQETSRLRAQLREKDRTILLLVEKITGARVVQRPASNYKQPDIPKNGVPSDAMSIAEKDAFERAQEAEKKAGATG